MKLPLCILLCILMVLIGSCINKSVKPEEQVITRNDAILYFSALAWDGCDTYFSFYENKGIAPSFYIASNETRKIIDDFIISEQNKFSVPANLNQISVTIKFKKTGKTGTLRCGWGKTSELNTMDILSVSGN